MPFKSRHVFFKRIAALFFLLAFAFSSFDLTVFSDGEITAKLRTSEKVIHSGAEFTLTVELSSGSSQDIAVEIESGKKTLSVTIPAGETAGSVKTRAGKYSKTSVEKYSVKANSAFITGNDSAVALKVLPKPAMSFSAQFLMATAGKKLTVYYKCKNASEMTVPLPMTLRTGDGRILKEFTVDQSNGSFQHTLKIEKDWKFPYALKAYNELTGASCASIPVMVVDTDRRGIRKVNTTEKKIALGFDCGYNNVYTDYIMDTLDEYGGKATFFVTGFFCEKFPEQLTKMHERGYEIGNHTMNHLRMTDLSAEEVYKEIQGVNQLVYDAAGVYPVIMRPPYGSTSPSIEAISRMSGCETVLWTMDSYDWDPKRSAETIIQRSTDGMGEGCIMLFHNSAPKTPKTLKTILEDYKAKGLEIVPISELLYDGHYLIDEKGTQTPDPDYRQISGSELLGNEQYTVNVHGTDTESEIQLTPVFDDASVSIKKSIVEKIEANPSLITVEYDFGDTIEAPVNKGDSIGQATFSYKNEIWFKADMTAASTVNASGKIKDEAAAPAVTSSDLPAESRKSNAPVIFGACAGLLLVIASASAVIAHKRKKK